MSSKNEDDHPDAATAVILHDGAWAARGHEVVRRGSRVGTHGGGPFLLLEPNDLVDFDASAIDADATRRVDIVEAATVYEERIVTDDRDRLVGITRAYTPPADRTHEVYVTPHPHVARAWARTPGPRSARWAVRRSARRLRLPRLVRTGRVRDAATREQALSFVSRLGDGLHAGAAPWPHDAAMSVPRGKRLFDIVFAAAALIATAPIMPFIMLAIWLEDGGPVIFPHTRQTRGGRNFVCYKFRTMCRDAEYLKARLRHANVCDGPQFYVRNDPRLLRTGRWLRRFHLDELPQFFNVLLGHMSIVGPRPSPDGENRFCPAWREARLSVRPGITGLWQVRRTREPQTDFHEWIRYDLEYVRHRSWRLDLWILCETVRCLVRRRRSREELHEAAAFRFPEEPRYRHAA